MSKDKGKPVSTLTRNCGVHCGTKDKVTGHCQLCHTSGNKYEDTHTVGSNGKS